MDVVVKGAYPGVETPVTPVGPDVLDVVDGGRLCVGGFWSCELAGCISEELAIRHPQAVNLPKPYRQFQQFYGLDPAQW